MSKRGGNRTTKSAPKPPMVNKGPNKKSGGNCPCLDDHLITVHRPTGPRTNKAIRARQVRIIDELGQQLGVIGIEDALRGAQEAGLDLIGVAATADQQCVVSPTWANFRFEQDKRARGAKKNQHVSEVKEVRLRPRTDEHDLQVRVRRLHRSPPVSPTLPWSNGKPLLEGRTMFAILARGELRRSRQPVQRQKESVAWVNEREARTRAS